MLTSDASTTFAVIDGATGAILRTGEAEIDHLSALFDHDGQDLIAPVPEGVSDDTHYWTGEDFAVYPPRPGDWAVWTGTEWIDPRSPEDIAAEAQARLDAARTAASMSRAELLLAAVGAGLIPASEAGAAARGEVPPSMQALFDNLPPSMRIEAVIRWGASTMIDRTNPILLALAAGMGSTDADLDALFGIDPTA